MRVPRAWVIVLRWESLLPDPVWRAQGEPPRSEKNPEFTCGSTYTDT